MVNMLWWLIRLLFNWITIERRNNYPRIEKFVETEHLSLLLHYITVLYYLVDFKKVNLLKIYIFIFWKAYFTFIYSDITSYVKNEIKNRNLKIYKKLEFLVYKFLYSFQLPNDIKEDIRRVYKTKFLNDSEERLLKLAKFLTVKKEIEINGKMYFNVYRATINNINNQLNRLAGFSIDSKKVSFINSYIDQVKRLKFSYRWNRLKKIYKISVLSHLYIVFGISYLLWKFKKLTDIQLLEVLLRSIFHDIPEALTGDIVAPTKKAVDWLEDLINNIEKDLVDEKLLGIFSDDLKKEIWEYMLRPFDGRLWKLVKISDLLSAMWEAKLEPEFYFQDVYRQLKRKLLNKNDKIIKHFIVFGDEYFLDNIEKIWQQFLNNK